jgi:rubrerythrin
MGEHADLQLIDAIELALQAEADAQVFYTAAAAACGDPRGKDMFAQLARFEQSHFENLKLLRANLTGESWSGYTGTEFRLDAPGGGAELDTLQIKSDIDAINLAIQAERKAADGYADLAEKARDPQVVDMFRKLSAEESLHLKVLEDQFFALSNEGHWVWGE